eukprot:COSAG01_NODE_938_length_12628_cov_8.320137_9_plen_288_part_00
MAGPDERTRWRPTTAPPQHQPLISRAELSSRGRDSDAADDAPQHEGPRDDLSRPKSAVASGRSSRSSSSDLVATQEVLARSARQRAAVKSQPTFPLAQQQLAEGLVASRWVLEPSAAAAHSRPGTLGEGGAGRQGGWGMREQQRVKASAAQGTRRGGGGGRLQRLPQRGAWRLSASARHQQLHAAAPRGVLLAEEERGSSSSSSHSVLPHHQDHRSGPAEAGEVEGPDGSMVSSSDSLWLSRRSLHPAQIGLHHRVRPLLDINSRQAAHGKPVLGRFRELCWRSPDL